MAELVGKIELKGLKGLKGLRYCAGGCRRPKLLVLAV
jgi:hypothetical protein